MVQFSTDADILKYEPILFGELHLPWQILTSGTGAELDDTTLTAADADFVAAGVAGGGVVYLKSADGSLDGAYEIVSAGSATQLTVSVLRADVDDNAVAPPAASSISYRVSTLGPQAGEAAFRLTEYFGVQPGHPMSTATAESIVDTRSCSGSL